ELVALPGDPNSLRLDRDAALALELHRVEHLLPHLAARDGVRQLEDPVGQRRLAVIDVRDDREVADAFLLHGPQPIVAGATRSAPAAESRRRSGTDTARLRR